MALKINITLDSHEDFNLLVESINITRTHCIEAAKGDDITPAERAVMQFKVQQLQNLKEKVTK